MVKIVLILLMLCLTPTQALASWIIAKGATSQTVYLKIYDSSDRKSTRLNSSHIQKSRMPSSA